MSPERRKSKQESKGRLLGSWITAEGIKQLTESECRISKDVSNDSDSYTSEWTEKTSSHFIKSEIEEVAHRLTLHGVGRHAKSKVNSYVSKYSWGGYQWSPVGPVNNWNSGEGKAGFEVDGINIQIRPRKND